MSGIGGIGRDGFGKLYVTTCSLSGHLEHPLFSS